MNPALMWVLIESDRRRRDPDYEPLLSVGSLMDMKGRDWLWVLVPNVILIAAMVIGTIYIRHG